MNIPSLANNRYQLVGLLGEGGMACVFRAYDTRLKVDKAIKIPYNFGLSNRQFISRFETEAETMAQLHHKNIVAIHDIRDEIFRNPNERLSINIVYIVMEILPGGSLKSRIDRHGMLHPQQAITAAIAMSSGLSYAHQHNVIHRDIKLDNVLIAADSIKSSKLKYNAYKQLSFLYSIFYKKEHCLTFVLTFFHIIEYSTPSDTMFLIKNRYFQSL